MIYSQDIFWSDFYKDGIVIPEDYILKNKICKCVSKKSPNCSGKFLRTLGKNQRQCLMCLRIKNRLFGS